MDFKTDLTGRKFNKLTVVRALDDYVKSNGVPLYRKWECHCECGAVVTSNAYSLLKGMSGSCALKGCGRNNYRALDIVGKNFGLLTVVRLLNVVKSGQRRWGCSCACGGKKIARTNDLTSGRITHCGCRHVKYQDRKIPALHKIYGNYKRNSKVRGITFELTLEEFQKITSSACHYCDSPPNQKAVDNRNYRHVSVYVYNGIDRSDNKLGYTTGNSVPCCKTCNSAKGTFTLREFSDWAARLFRRMGVQALVRV
jgi:hypothetical protein